MACWGLISLVDFLKLREFFARQSAICFHHAVNAGSAESIYSFQTLIIARKARAASAMIGRSTRMFLLIWAASISRWIFFDAGEKASTRPVTRSSKREPSAIKRSQRLADRFDS